jgi:hypothetical protein
VKLIRWQCCAADTQGHTDVVGFTTSTFMHCRNTHALGNHGGACKIAARHDDNELIATKATYNCIFASCCTYGCRESFQHIIANGVPEMIIYWFEAIYIDEGHRKRTAVVRTSADAQWKFTFEHVACANARECVALSTFKKIAIASFKFTIAPAQPSLMANPLFFRSKE